MLMSLAGASTAGAPKLGRVSTTCGSRWVRGHGDDLSPPLTLEAKGSDAQFFLGCIKNLRRSSSSAKGV